MIIFFILTHAFSYLLLAYSNSLEVTYEMMKNKSAKDIVLMRTCSAFLPIVIILAAWSCRYWSKRVFSCAFTLTMAYIFINFSTFSIPIYLVPWSILAIGIGFLASIWKKQEDNLNMGYLPLPA
jgi:hypothetical protein